MTLIRRGTFCFTILAGAVFAAGIRVEARPQSPTEPQVQPQTPSQVPTPAQAPSDKPDPTLTMKIGNAKLKDKTMDVAVGALLASDTGVAVGFDRMMQTLAASRLIYVGETHNSLPMHEIQYQVIRALYARDRAIAVGLEMLPVTLQETLNRWSLGLLTRDEFIREARWYVNWNFNFGFYEKIFEFAKEHRIPIYALNVPREIITKIRMKGWDGFTDEEKKLIPHSPDLTNKDHRTLIRTIFESSEIPHQMKGAGLDMMFEGLYRGQSAWDEVMAANAVKGAESEGRRLVVCVGSGHVLYNLGTNMRANDKSGFPYKTIVAVIVPGSQKSLKVSRTIADYVFGLAEESRPGFPNVGLSLKKVENLENLIVDNKPTDGAASRFDFEKGDVVLSVDGQAYSDINELRMHMAQFKCGDEIKFRLLRSGQVKDVVLRFDKCAQPLAASPEKKTP